MGTEETNIIFTSVLLAVFTFGFLGYSAYLYIWVYLKHKTDFANVDWVTAHKRTSLSEINPNVVIMKHEDRREIPGPMGA